MTASWDPEPWDPAAAGVLRLPSGPLVRGRGLGQPTPEGPEPTLGLYLLDAAPPAMPWTSVWVPWTDFGLPHDADVLELALSDARAHEGRVELACWGGTGRTGTALACLVTLDGLTAREAIAYVRQHYRAKAIETPEQEEFVSVFAARETVR